MRHHDKYLPAGFYAGATISDRTELVFEAFFSANTPKAAALASSRLYRYPVADNAHVRLSFRYL